MDIVEKTNIKNNILKCIDMCGGLTGKFAKKLCDDDSIYRELMEDGKIKRIPIEVKMSDKTTKKMYLFAYNNKQKASQFPHMKEDDARYISILNNCYCSYPNAQWFERSDIHRFVETAGVTDTKLIPRLMFFSEDKIVAVYMKKSYAKLTEKERQVIDEKLNVNIVLEYLY